MSAEITPEQVARLRKMVEVGGRSNAWRKSDYLAILDALESSRAEVEALRHEVELTNEHEYQILTERSDAVELEALRKIERCAEEFLASWAVGPLQRERIAARYLRAALNALRSSTNHDAQDAGEGR